MIIQSQIQITIQMENLLQAGRANPTHHAPAPPSLANTCRFSYMQGGPSQHASPRPPSLAHTCIFSYMQGGPVQHASPPLPLPPSLIRVYSLTCRVGQSNTPRPPSPPSLANTCIFSYMHGGPIQHASPPPPLHPSLIRVYSLTCMVGQSNTPRPLLPSIPR